jgi:ADP-ribosylglycohydrolase
MAAAVAEAMKPEATVDSVIEASTAYLHKKSSKIMIDRIKETLELAKEVNDYKLFREKFYEKYLYYVTCDSRETVPCTIALFYLAKGDPVKSILYGVNFGRDADTIGTMVGALAGAFRGVSGLKPEWVEKIKKNSPKQEELAEKIVGIINKRFKDAQDSLVKLNEINK